MAVDSGELLGVALIGCFVSMCLTPLMAGMARRLALLDHPRDYKAHFVPTPFLGGLAVAGGTVLGVVWFLHLGATAHAGSVAPLALGALIIVGAGLVDDVWGLAPQHKLISQIAATSGAGFCMALLGVRLNMFLPWPAFPMVLLTVLWVVGITNAVNFLDNMDGLCAGLGTVAAFSLAVINLRTGELAVAGVAAALGGACLGFLPYNWPHARIFLGDTGSMLIGFLLAALAVAGVYTRGAQVPELAIFTPLFVLAIPILDSVLVIILRLHAGHPPWVGDRRHISHRLVQRGMHPAAAVATLWMAAGACGLAALLLPTVGAAQAPVLLGLLLCALGALAAAAGTRGLS